MAHLACTTERRRQVVDLTDRLNDIVSQAPSKHGLLHVFVLHTTATLTVADLDPGTDLDMLDAFEAMVPKLQYRHPHNPAHVGDHIMSSLIGSSVLLPFADGKLALGTWQRVVLVEFDGPKERKLMLTFLEGLEPKKES